MKRQLVREGDWFAVPLREGGYGIGIVARKAKGGILLGYFFGPRTQEIPTLEDVMHLSPQDAVLVDRVGDLSLRDRRWPILGPSKTWTRDAWPLPKFARIEPLSGRAWIVTYSDDAGTVVREEPCPIHVASTLLESGLSGDGSIEIQLTQILSPPQPPEVKPPGRSNQNPQ